MTIWPSGKSPGRRYQPVRTEAPRLLYRFHFNRHLLRRLSKTWPIPPLRKKAPPFSLWCHVGNTQALFMLKCRAYGSKIMYTELLWITAKFWFFCLTYTGFPTVLSSIRAMQCGWNTILYWHSTPSTLQSLMICRDFPLRPGVLQPGPGCCNLQRFSSRFRLPNLPIRKGDQRRYLISAISCRFVYQSKRFTDH